MKEVGGRKFVLGILFMVLTSAEVSGIIYAIATAQATGWDAAGVASLIGAQASGVLAVVWGNVKEHQAKSNGAKP